jgi:opine dehydrogenase
MKKRVEFHNHFVTDEVFSDMSCARLMAVVVFSVVAFIDSSVTFSSALIQRHDVARFGTRTSDRAALPTRTTRFPHSSSSSDGHYDLWNCDAFGKGRHGGPPIKVGIAGAGAVAFGTAAILSRNGHDVMLWSPSGKSTSDFQIQEEIATADEHDDRCRGNRHTLLVSTGAMKHEFVPRIAESSQQLVNDNSVIIIALPANGHKMVFDEIAPHLVDSISIPLSPSQGPPRNKHIVISSHASLGALYLSNLLLQYSDEEDQYQSTTPKSSTLAITAWGTTVCTARRPSGHQVDIKSIRKSVDLCTIPGEATSFGLHLCRRLFPDTEFRSRDGLLAISLSNLNPQNHLGMALGNMSRMERGEDWYQFRNTTPKIGALLEALDRERLEIADALDVDVKTIYEHFSLSFHVPAAGSISDMCQQIFAAGHDVYGPSTAESRYITEDVPFGLALTVALGRLVNKPAMLHESGLAICSAMYGQDFVAENDLLQALDLRHISLEDLKGASHSGRLRVPRNLVLRSEASRAAGPVHP